MNVKCSKKHISEITDICGKAANFKAIEKAYEVLGREIPELMNANACYSGGGIYIYYGQLVDGRYFFADDFDPSITILDVDPIKAEEWDAEFFEEHQVDCIYDENSNQLMQKILRYIMDNEPDGNYAMSEINFRYAALLENMAENENRVSKE